MRLDFKKFKKVKSDAKSTVLKHADGHTITIAHDSLAPKMKSALHALPTFDEGGEIPGGKGSPNIDPEKAKEVEKGAKKSGIDPKTWIKNIKEGLGMADGGEVPNDSDDQEYVKVPKQLLQQHVQQLQGAAPQQQRGVPQVSPEEEGIQSYNPIDTLTDLAKIAGINIKKSMDADTQLYHDDPDAWMRKQAFNTAVGSLGGAPGAMGKAAMVEGELANAAKPANFMQRAAIEKAEQDAARRAAGKFNANEANAMDQGIQKAADVNAKIASRVKQPQPLSDGGEIKQSNPKLEESKKQPPIPHLADGDEVVDVSDIGQVPAIDPVKAADPNTIPGMAEMQPSSPQQAPALSPASAVPALSPTQSPEQDDDSSQQAPGMQMPSVEGGYQNRLQGIEQEAAARGDLGKAQADILKQAAAIQQQQVNDFKANYADLEKERLAHMADIKAGFVSPDKYWNDHSKLATGIGIILAGFSPKANGGNAALQFLNDNINRSMQAQAQNLQAEHNLLAANLHQFGNMRDATAMTRVMMTDIMKDKLDRAAAMATSPMAKANALQLKGQLQMQAAPEFLQLAMRRSLMKQNAPGGQQQFSQQDPAAYVPYVVPKEQQKEVFKEIKSAQDAKQNQAEIMKQFDIAASSPLKSIGVGQGAAAAKRMEALFLPMIHDQEGRVNEYEQKTLQQLMPTTGDTAKTLASKKEGLQSFINNKMAAPTARGFGINLENFQNTSRSPEASLSPQQQSFVQWAKQNPGNPKADMVLKKLGVK